MNINDQSRECHAERSEASRRSTSQMLRCAQHDSVKRFTLIPIDADNAHEHIASIRHMPVMHKTNHLDQL